MSGHKVMVVATHPDDETLGCGGTLLKHQSVGDSIYWVIATEMREEAGFEQCAIRRRDMEIEKIAQSYRFADVVRLGLTTTMVDRMPVRDVVETIAGAMGRVKPNIVYLPFAHDVHSDHRSILSAAYSAAKAFRSSCIKRLLMMETLSETDAAPALSSQIFVPNFFVDISAFIRAKCDMLRIYKSELGRPPFPRSIATVRSLASFRGASAGCRFAESFMSLKELW